MILVDAILKYPGAKWRIADWIISHFPEHHSYLEPFFGSGAVFFHKSRSNIETINDLDGEVVNFFECVRSDPERIAHEVFLTPYSREVYTAAYEGAIPEDPFARAIRFMVCCNMGYGFRTNGVRVGWKYDIAGRERAYTARAWANLPEVVIETAARLREVQIENCDAAELIRRFNNPNVLVYCDPPYVMSTRYGKQYRCEMTNDDHVELLDTLKRHKGPVVISGYQSELYDQELAGWRKDTTVSADQLSQVKSEVLWMNFDPPEQMRLEI